MAVTAVGSAPGRRRSRTQVRSVAVLPFAFERDSRIASPKTFRAAVGWTFTLDPEKKRDHDFANLLQELVYAVQRQDGAMTTCCVDELRRMFRERKP